MRTEPPGNTERGTSWVIVQFILLSALLAAGPIWRAPWDSFAARASGGALLLLSAWLGLRGKRDLGAQRTAFPRPKDGQLVTSGLYSRMRHPLYASVMAFGFAWALLWQSGPALVLATLQVPFFDAKARREERWLRELFPDYDLYSRQVKRFIPGIY